MVICWVMLPNFDYKFIFTEYTAIHFVFYQEPNKSFSEKVFKKLNETHITDDQCYSYRTTELMCLIT